MSATMDVDTAWSLVRAAGDSRDGNTYPLRIPYDPCPDVWLQVDASGTWTSSVTVTEAASRLLDLYLPIQCPGPLVIGQLGQSLDGRIATEDGESHYITGQPDLLRLHRVRALVDAVIVGAGTVESDDPRLSVRLAPGPSPVRVVLDPNGRVRPDRQVFTDGKAPTISVQGPHGTKGSLANADVLRLAVDSSKHFAPANIVESLARLGLTRLLVEGGGVTVSRFLEAGLLDRLHVTVAPLIIGSGKPAFTLPPVDLAEAIRPPCRRFQLGDDVLFDLDLR